jgi:CMP-N-acetylneuraminic acid synthetase
MFKNVREDVETLVVFGFGNGNAYEYIKKKLKHIKRVVFFEPTTQIFKEVVKYYPFKKSVLDKRLTTSIYINIPDNEIQQYAAKIVGNSLKVDVVFHTAYCTLFKNQYDLLNKSVMETLRDMMINMVTSSAGEYNWVINTFHNLRRDFTPIEKVKENIDLDTAIIVSAGPSLDKNMELLEKVKDRALIVAVGNAIKILNTRGIIPHFRCAIDGFIHEKWTLEGIDTTATSMLFSTTIYRDVLEEYYGNIFEFVLDGDPLAEYIYKQCKLDRMSIQSGFSVANIAFDVVMKLGAKKVVFMGQDLCYTNDKLYADGSWRNSKVNFDNPNYIKDHDIYGNDVYTTKVFLGMKKILETKIKQNPCIEYINATEGGLNIEGTVNKTLEEVIATLNENVDIKEAIRDAKESYLQEKEALKEKLLEVIKKIHHDIGEVINLCEYKLKRIKKIDKQKKDDKKLNKLFKEINRMDSFNQELKDNCLYNEVIKPGLMSKIRAIESSYYLKDNELRTKLDERQKVVYRKVLEYRLYSKIIQECAETFIQEEKIHKDFIKNAIFFVPAVGKNYMEKLKEHSLIEYSLKELNRIKAIENTIVYTDQPQVIERCKKIGVDIKHKEMLEESSMDGLYNILNNKENQYEYVVLIHPDYPLRKGKDLLKSIEFFLENNADTVASVSKIDRDRSSYRKINEEGYLEKYEDAVMEEGKERYEINDAICITKTENFLKNKSFYGDKVKGYILHQNNSVKAEGQFGLALAETLLMNELSNRKKIEFINQNK